MSLKLSTCSNVSGKDESAVSGMSIAKMLPRSDTMENIYKCNVGSPGVKSGRTRASWGARIAPNLQVN